VQLRSANAIRAVGITYADLFREHHERVVSLCWLLLPDPQEAEEICQQVFTELLQALRGAAQPFEWGEWLTRATLAACRTRRRSRWQPWRRSLHDVLRDGVERAPTAGASGLAADAPAGKARAQIWHAFRQLPIRQREVFVMRQLEGWSAEDVAAELRLSVRGVENRMSRAVGRLRGTVWWQ
jgi:RNA polymerase sigma-70 factor (ECF subfamily)